MEYQFIQQKYEEDGYSITVDMLSVYYVIGTITTVGYGDLTPQTPISMIFTILIELLGIIFYGYSFAKVKQYINDGASPDYMLKEKKEELQSWMLSRVQNHPDTSSQDSKVLTKILSTFEFILLHNYPEIYLSEFFCDLPHSIKVQASEELVKLLTNQFPSFFKFLRLGSVFNFAWRIYPRE